MRESINGKLIRVRYSIFDITAVRLTVYPVYVHVRERLVCIINHQKCVMYIPVRIWCASRPVVIIVIREIAYK